MIVSQGERRDKLPRASVPDVITSFDLFFCSTVFFFLLVGGRCLGSRQKQKPTIADGREVKRMRENLKSARRAKGMTQQAVADYLGITLRHYQKVEYEEVKGSFEIWDALEDLLGVHQRILRISSNSRPGKEESL